MAIISMRELHRDPRRVFSELEEKGDEPFLITRQGKPVAMLLPVGPKQDVTTLLLSALPEFGESRREAEHARAEGRTIPLSQLLELLEKRESEATETS